MKTANEIFEAKKKNSDSIRNFAGFSITEIKQIQLDAMREGMRRAAIIVESRISFVENFEPAQVNNQQDRRGIMQAILYDANTLTIDNL